MVKEVLTMQRINRTAAIIKPNQPFVDWLNSLPDDGHVYTLKELSADNLTFLIPEADSRKGAIDYIRKRYDLIFEWELWGWVSLPIVFP